MGVLEMISGFIVPFSSPLILTVDCLMNMSYSAMMTRHKATNKIPKNRNRTIIFRLFNAGKSRVLTNSTWNIPSTVAKLTERRGVQVGEMRHKKLMMDIRVETAAALENPIPNAECNGDR